MRALTKLLNALMQDRRGATAVEYGLILALVFLALAAGTRVLGTATSGTWNNIAAKVAAVVS